MTRIGGNQIGGIVGAGVGSPGASNMFGSAYVPSKPNTITSAAILQRPFLPVGINNVQQLMGTPPTIAVSTTNPLSTGQAFLVDNNSPLGVNLSNFTITRSGNPISSGQNFPDSVMCAFATVSASINASVLSYAGSNIVQVGVIHTGTEIVIGCKGLSGAQIFVKVNDQYASLSPTVIGSNGAINYMSVTFGSSATRRIDFLCDNVLSTFRFYGMYVGQTDTLAPAPIRGPQNPIIIVGDSYTTATAAGGQALGYVGVMSEYLGWDNIWPAGVGGTGFVNNGSYANFLARLGTDVVPFNPDEVILVGSVNDLTVPYLNFLNALLAIVAFLQTNLPATRITFVGPTVLSGSGYQAGASATVGYPAQRAAFSQMVSQSTNVNWIDPSSTNPVTTPQTFTLTSSPAAGATSFTCSSGGFIQGSTVQFPDGSRSFVRSTSGLTFTVDQVSNPQTAGTQIVTVPSCYMRGNGYQGAPTGVGNADLLVYSDHIHPTPLGHLTLGLVIASAYVNLLNSSS